MTTPDHSHRRPAEHDSYLAQANVAAVWFRWVGGVTSILGPILLLAGVLLRIRFHFFFPDQLAAFQQHPMLILVSYSAFALGNAIMWPALATLASTIAIRSPGWAIWGGTLAIFGLFARTFHAGVDHLAFQLVRVQDLGLATRAVGDSYGAYYVLNAFNLAIMVGWVALAIGAYRSRTMGPFRALALALMSALMLGVLKGSTWVSVLATSGLCVAMVPFGIQKLREGPRAQPRELLKWSLLTLGTIVVLIVLGQLG